MQALVFIIRDVFKDTEIRFKCVLAAAAGYQQPHRLCDWPTRNGDVRAVDKANHCHDRK